jgi:hypothetical protein
MPKTDSQAALRAIHAAIVNGTKRMKGEEFFWGVLQQLHHYKPSKHDDFRKWLRKAGVNKAPSTAQCSAFAKLARSKRNSVLAIYGPPTRNY